MSVEHIGKGYVKICVSEEELEDSIAGLSQLKPILQAQVLLFRKPFMRNPGKPLVLWQALLPPSALLWQTLP